MNIRRFTTIAAVLAGLAGLSAGRAYAQSSERLRAKVSFDFKVGQEVLPAGIYDLTYDASDSPGVLFVRNEDGRHSAVALTEGTSADKTYRDATLVFDRQGSDYVLAKVFGPDDADGLEVVGTQPAD